MPTLEQLAAAHNWIALGALVLTFALTRLSKADTAFPLTIPSRWRPLFAFAVGEVLVAASTAIYNAALGGHMTWQQMLQTGAYAGLGAILTHTFGVQVLRGGRDVPVPAKLSVRPPPPPGGPSVVDIPPPSKVPSAPKYQRRSLRELAALAAAVVAAVLAFDCTPPVAKLATTTTCDAIVVAVDPESGQAQQLCGDAGTMAGLVADVFAQRAASSVDAGVPVGHMLYTGPCTYLPKTNVCATNVELLHAMKAVRK